MHEEIGAHPLWHVPGLPGVLGELHADTLLTTWVAMLIAIAFFWWLGNSYKTNHVRKTQATFEGIIQFLADLAVGTLGPKGERFVPVFVGIFLFIWILNEFGVLFLKALGLPSASRRTAGRAP